MEAIDTRPSREELWDTGFFEEQLLQIKILRSLEPFFSEHSGQTGVLICLSRHDLHECLVGKRLQQLHIGLDIVVVVERINVNVNKFKY